MNTSDTTSASPAPLPSIGQLESALRRLLPNKCGVAVEPLGAGSDALRADEAAAIVNAVPKRRAEFVAGRIAARRALAEIGVRHAIIRAGADRAPEWPAEVVGSISHAGTVAAAAVGTKSAVASIGIDLEVDAAVRRELWRNVLLPSEQAWVETRSPAEQARWATTIFSAKEAFYKFQYPLTRQWLDFTDVEITFADAGRFSVRVLRPPSPLLAAVFHGDVAHLEGFALTVMHRPAETRA